MLNNDRIAIAAPRNHAKSTMFTLVYVLWCIVTKRKKFILLLSDTQAQAEELLGTIVEELETNEKLKKDYGKLAGYLPAAMEEKQNETAKVEFRLISD